MTQQESKMVKVLNGSDVVEVEQERFSGILSDIDEFTKKFAGYIIYDQRECAYILADKRESGILVSSAMLSLPATTISYL